jgi:eukaryotic-like serine/threonine-protein kinase
VLYECLTAMPAFSGTAAAAVMAKIMLAEPPPLKAGCPDAPRSLIALVDRMLAKNLGHRLPDAGAVVSQIDALGRLPRSRRRASRQHAAQPTRAARPTDVRHCIVVAGRGTADELLEPPSSEQQARLAAAAQQRHAIVETLASGTVVAHLTGVPEEVSNRAAWLALAMRDILPGWTIAISSVRNAIAAAADQGAALLTHTALGTAFRGKDAGGIAVDPETAELLKEKFELDAAHRLVGATSGMIEP